MRLLGRADELRRRFADVLEPRGITFQQYNVLRILRGAGPDGLPTLTIAERMIEKTPGVTRLLDKLEKKRLISRARSSRDRREVICKVTSKGSTLLDELDRPVDEADEQALAPLSHKDRRELRRILGILSSE